MWSLEVRSEMSLIRFEELEDRVLQLLNKNGKPCVGTAWIVGRYPLPSTRTVVLTSVVTGVAHTENWRKVKYWVATNAVRVINREDFV